MYIRILRNCLIKGTHSEAGSVVEVDHPTGRALITIRRAQEVAAPILAQEVDGKPAPRRTVKTAK